MQITLAYWLPTNKTHIPDLTQGEFKSQDDLEKLLFIVNTARERLHRCPVCHVFGMPRIEIYPLDPCNQFGVRHTSNIETYPPTDLN